MNDNKIDTMSFLVDKYIELYFYPYTSPKKAFFQWMKRFAGNKNAFLELKNHDLSSSFQAHKEISSIIRARDLNIQDLKDFVVYIKIHKEKLGYKTILIFGQFTLVTVILNFFKVLSIDFSLLVTLFFMIMVLERVYLNKYKILYDELIYLVEREIDKLQKTK